MDEFAGCCDVGCCARCVDACFFDVERRVGFRGLESEREECGRRYARIDQKRG